MAKAFLIGREPDRFLGFTYVTEGPFDGVGIGSLTISELLYFNKEEALFALAQGKPVLLYTPGLPESPKNRSLAAALAARRRELKNWGVLFADGLQKRLVTAQEARLLRQNGKEPLPGAVLTPLAKEILEGTD